MTNVVVHKGIKSKKIFADNQFHSILRLLDVLPNFPLTTSEMMGDYYLQKWLPNELPNDLKLTTLGN